MTVRIVRIIDRMNIGGPSKHVTWLTAGLRAEDFETTLITGTVPPGEGDMSYFARALGVEPLVIREMSREIGLRDIIVIFKLLRVFFQLRPQIVHTHKAKAGAAGRVAALLYKWLTPSALWLRPRAVRVVHTYHGHIFHSYYGTAKTRGFLAIERLLAWIATDCIIAISPRQRHEIHEVYGVGRAKQFAVIPLGLDFEEAGQDRAPGLPRLPSLKDELNVANGTSLVGIAGRLCEVKNHALFLESAARLKAQGVAARYAIIGDGHLRQPLESQAASLGVSDCVTFTGFRDDAMSLYAGLDIVALTSLNEGTPLTLIEAMSHGCAVASTEVGGVVDLMGTRQQTVDGVTVWDHGVTVPSRDHVLFSNALKYLMERPALRREMGARARACVLSRYSKERLVRDIEELYRELLK